MVRFLFVAAIIDLLVGSADITMAVPWLPLAAMGVSTLGQMFAQNQASQKREEATEEQRQLLEDQMSELSKYFNEEYYKDYLQTQESQNILGRLRDQLRKTYNIQESNAVSSGATHAQSLAGKEDAQEVITGTMRDILSRATGRKQQLKGQYLNQKMDIMGKKAGLESQVGRQKAETWENVSRNIGNLGNLANLAYGMGVFGGSGGRSQVPTQMPDIRGHRQATQKVSQLGRRNLRKMRNYPYLQNFAQ